eukprot:GFKZ01011458.1.p1 GENE.GFKZ01011458.1~~GFKZ01011458.1.p1  ORF type:complete len:811 (-),score=111.61 GFKZ01011458.1:164-2596(-)
MPPSISLHPAFAKPQPIPTFRRLSLTPSLSKRPRTAYFSPPLCIPSLVRQPLMTVSTSVTPSTSPPVLPSGPVTIVLQIRFRPGLTLSDQKALLSEYARHTCADPGVIRCDVMYQVNSQGLPKSSSFDIWLFFEQHSAYLAHEKTSHAGKLRMWLANPSGGDNAVILTKLSFASRVLHAVYPKASEWKSHINYSVESPEQRDRRVADAAVSMLRSEPSRAGGVSDTYRKSLEVLLSHVGLENVIVLVASATAASESVVPALIGLCEEYIDGLEKVASVVRTGIFAERNRPLEVVLVSVHDAESRDGAFFDADFVTDFLDDDGWKVRRFYSVFPDKVGWERTNEHGEWESETQQDSFLRPIKGPQESSANKPAVQALGMNNEENLNSRLIHGAGAFDKLKAVIREVTGIASGTVKVMIICGWNASRVAPLLSQIQVEKEKDPGVIRRKQGLAVFTCMPNVKRLRQGMAFVREYEPDIIIGYGGGSVLDMTKIVGRLGHASREEVEDCIAKINEAARNDAGRLMITPLSQAIPVLLIPGKVTPGSEMAEMCIIEGEAGKRRSRRMVIDFVDRPGLLRSHNERVIINDSRVIAPRRLPGRFAAQGALMLVCRGLETIISAYENPDLETMTQVEEGIKNAYDNTLPALREPANATGSSRDPLAAAQTQIGLVADCVGRLGVCTRLALAVVDELLDGPQPLAFQMILIRVTVALVEELERWTAPEADRIMVALMVAMGMKTGAEVVRSFSHRAEDVDCLLLSQHGLVRRKIPTIAAHVRKTILEEPVSTYLERRLAEEGVFESVLYSAIDQKYEL